MFLFEHNEIVNQLKKYPILDKLSVDSLKKLIDASEIIEFPADTILFQINEPSDCVYYVIDGYIELFSSSLCDKKIASVRSGGMLGETSVLAGEPHAFTAKTNNVSQLIKINRETFLQFFQEDPHVLMQLTQNVARRLRRMVMGLTAESYPYRKIVLYNISKIPLENFKQYFSKCALQDKTYIHDKQSFEATKLDIIPFLFQCENNYGINIFLLEPGDDVWTKSVLFHAEYIYLITDENSWQTLPIEVIDGESTRPCDLVIVHENNPPYSNTSQFYAQYPFKRHHHFQDKKAWYQRIYRYMTGQAIGLVISAGGFRGYAHYGLIKALLESGAPIDCIGGCSFGAAIGAGLAENFNWETFKTIYERSIAKFRVKRRYHLDYTLPFTSILSGAMPTKVLQEVYVDRRIEDIPINFFCVTANLSARRKELKHFGEIWEWLRASVAIPGIFPPLEKEGDIYVDGAICTSLPIQDMREYLDNGGKIISLDVRSPLLLKDKHQYSFPPVLSFKEMLAYKLGLSQKKYVLPNIFDILLESSLVDQHLYDSEGLKKADIAITADTSSLSFADPSVGDPQSLIAYAFAKEKLKEYQHVFARWL